MQRGQGGCRAQDAQAGGEAAAQERGEGRAEELEAERPKRRRSALRRRRAAGGEGGRPRSARRLEEALDRGEAGGAPRSGGEGEEEARAGEQGSAALRKRLGRSRSEESAALERRGG